MDEFLGPRDRNNELTANEELEILEAYQSADEYLNMDNDVDDFYFESEEQFTTFKKSVVSPRFFVV